MPARTPLTDWTLTSPSKLPVDLGDGIPATVPGTATTDLLAAGLIDDPYLDRNEFEQKWIGESDFTYTCTVPPATGAGYHRDIVFEGIDTVAEILLDGQAIGQSRSMHLAQRIGIDSFPDGGVLEVRFSSPVKYADAESLRSGSLFHTEHHPFNAIRKNHCSFGWDWGIDTATSGLWRPVWLHEWSGRLDKLTVRTDVDGDSGTVRVSAAVLGSGSEVRVTVGGQSVTAPVVDGGVEATVELPAVERWWPVGYGDQPLYDVEIVLLSDGETADEAHRRVGFRTVEWRQQPDDGGTSLELIVNDTPIVVRGINWIPDDCFPHRVTRERLRERFEQARFARVNLVRVWGGGVYESDDFFELCDEIGLLSWQDCLMACAFYDEREPMRGLILSELRQNLARIAHHPSLCMIAGSNEVLAGVYEWGFAPSIGGRDWGARYYFEWFPEIVAEVAPGLQFIPSSPFSPGPRPEDGGHLPNAEEHGSVHLWETWNSLSWQAYRTYRPRFVAEFGWQGPPTWATIKQAVHDDPLTPESPGMAAHQKAPMGNTKLMNGMLNHYDMPTTMEEWHWAGQLVQANALQGGIEWFRSLWPRCTGTVMWQLNDCWPVVSWSAVDGYGRPKPLLHALRAAHADRLATFQPTDGGVELVLLNATGEEWAVRGDIGRVAFDGTVLESVPVDEVVPAHGAVRVAAPSTPGDASAELLVWGPPDPDRAVWWFDEPRDLKLPAPEADVEVSGTTVTITARTLLREATLLTDKVDADSVADKALVTLLPGESVEISIGRTGHDWTVDDARSVLVTANDLVSRT